MAIFPKIQRPCPYKGDISEIMDGDVCGLCRRHVFDLTGMSDAARIAFVQGCKSEVCVRYRFRPALALAAAAAMAASVGACARDPVAQDAVEMEESVVGGLPEAANAEYFEGGAVDEVP